MQLVNSESGARLVLYGHTSGSSYNLSKQLWFDNIASRNTAEFLRDINKENTFYWDVEGEREWPAVVLTPEECKLRVGGMSVTELRQKLADYWGQSDAAVGWGYQDMAAPTIGRERLTPANHRVLSQWVDRECTQWLNYFIAKNHTFGAVHAWYAAFLGVTRRSLDNLSKSVTHIARSHQAKTRWHDPMGEAFMESIHLIKFRMSFDVCIEGHDEVVDGLPSLPSNTVTTANEKGIQIIHDSIHNLLPRRIWDICANTVIPATWFCGPPCPLTSRQEVGALGVKPVSHAWVADEDRNNILTEANQQMWPIPLPKGVLLEDVREQMIHLGVRYAWLDVLCLRQRAQPTLKTELVIPVSREVVKDVALRTEAMESIPLHMKEEAAVKRREQHRLEEWKVDVPTIGAIYSNLGKHGLYGGGQ